MSFWRFIENAATETKEAEIELRIEGDIVDDEWAWLYEWFGIQATSPNAFRNELAKYAGKNITVWIDSYGGSVFAAAGMYNALMEHKKAGAKVTAKIDGKAMSAATIPFMAGDERLMSPMAMFMMHNPLLEVYGYASELRKAADVLDEVKETIINSYQLGTGRSRAKISTMMDDETYMSARTAIKEGFATGMLYAGGEGGAPGTEPTNLMYSRLAVVNAANTSVRDFLEMAKNKNLQIDAEQAQAPEPSPEANKNNMGGNEQMEIKTTEDLKKEYPELVAQIEASAKAEGVKEGTGTGAQAERDRIKAIDEISPAIDPALVNKAKYEEPLTAEQLALAAVKNDAGKGTKYLADAAADAGASGSDKVEGQPQGDAPGGKEKNAQEEAAAAQNIADQANKRRKR